MLIISRDIFELDKALFSKSSHFVGNDSFIDCSDNFKSCCMPQLGITQGGDPGVWAALSI